MMRKTYTNLEDLEFNVQNYSKQAMIDSLVVAKNKLLEFVEKEVYDGAYKPKWYTNNMTYSSNKNKEGNMRSYALRKFRVQKIVEDEFGKKVGNNIYSRYAIGLDPESLKSNRDFVNNDGNSPRRYLTPDNLIAIVNNGISNETKFGFPNMPPRPFWDDFLYWFAQNFEKIYLSECAKRGLYVKSNKSLNELLGRKRSIK